MSCSIHPLRRPLQIFHIIGGLLALLFVLVLPGCGAVRLAYNNAPTLSYWWLDSYLDLGEAQSIQLRADLAGLQDWHRQHELPRYVSTLESLQRMAPTQVTPDQVCDLSAGLKTRLETLLNQTAPTLLALAQNTQANQLDHLARQFEKHNQKWRADWLQGSPTERNERRLQQLADRAEMLYGRLEEPQWAVLRTRTANSGFDPNWRYLEMLRRQQDTLATLRQILASKKDEAQAAMQVRALLARLLNPPDAGYRQYTEKVTAENCRTLAALHNSTTPTQRRSLLKTLQDYAAEARTLMATGR